MEFLRILLPFLLAGIGSTFVSRFTGVAVSFLMVPIILALGAKPPELLAFMLTFLVYHNFTQETQNARLDFKQLYIFGGIKKYALIVAILIIALIQPFLAVTIFLFAFIAELSALLYFKQKADRRPNIRQLIQYGLFMSIITAIGVVGMHWIPAKFYFYFVGLAMLIMTAFAWYAGRDRSRFYKTWLWIWSAFGIFMGLFGLDSSVYLKSLRRTFKSNNDYMFGIVSMTACFVGLLVLYVMDQIYSVPALIAAIGAGFGTRFFGVYEYNNQGGFSILIVALTVLIVLVLMAAAPKPIGFTEVNHILNHVVK